MSQQPTLEPAFSCFEPFCGGPVYPYRETIEITEAKDPDPVKRKKPLFKCSGCGKIYYDGDVKVEI